MWWFDHRLQRLVEKIVAVLRLAEFAHFFYFLLRGGAAHLLERLLKMGTVYCKQKPILGEIARIYLSYLL